MAYQAGSMDRQQLMDEFGLNAKGLASSNTGSSTGVKSNPLLGTGYLTDDDTQRLLGNENLKNAFIEKGGEANSWETINDVDSVLDWLSQEPAKEDPAPIAHQINTPAPVAVAVAENAAVRQPIEGIDYPTGPVNAAIERIQAYNKAIHESTAGDSSSLYTHPMSAEFIQNTYDPELGYERSEPDYDTAQAAQDLADKYRFEIAQNLQPDPQSVVNALTTAIPDKLGVYS